MGSGKKLACTVCGAEFIPDKFHPYQRTCSNACSRKAEYEKHKEKYVARAKRWTKNNHSKNTICQRNYRHRNVAKVRLWRRVNQQRRLARLRRVEVGDVTLKAFLILCEAQKFRCWWCGKRKQLGMDHIVPIGRGGKHGMKNIIPSCSLCNSIKKDRIWPLSSGRLFRG